MDVTRQDQGAPPGTFSPGRKKLGKSELVADKGRELLRDISNAGARRRAGRPTRTVVWTNETESPHRVLPTSL